MLARHGLTAANANGAGQTVAAGTLDQLAALAADPPAKARVIALQVAGAFHTVHMSPAGRGRSSGCRPTSTSATRESRCCPTPTARPVADGADALARLVRQVSSPVRWDQCMQTLVDLGVTAMIELPRPARSSASPSARCPELPHWQSRRPTTSRRHSS